MEKFKGRVVYVGEVKTSPKGAYFGFKIDSFDGFLNMFAKVQDDLPKMKVGIVVEGEYKKVGTYNNVENVAKVELNTASVDTQSSLKEAIRGGGTDFVPATETRTLAIKQGVLDLDIIFEEMKNTMYFQYFKDEPEALQALMSTVFIQINRKY